MVMISIPSHTCYYDGDANDAGGDGGTAGFMSNVQNYRVSIQLAQQTYGGHEVRRPQG